MNNEYLMLRAEIETCLKKQEQVFGIIISFLGLTNIFPSISENVSFLFLILFLSTLLQLRMLEYRNIIYYISTYMVVFLEKYSDYKWETRLRSFKIEGYGFEEGTFWRKLINVVVVRFGRVVKHFSILGLVVFMLLRIVINVYKSYHVLWIKVVLYGMAGLFAVFNILYIYTLNKDKANYSAYLKRWEKIKHLEQQEWINSKEA